MISLHHLSCISFLMFWGSFFICTIGRGNAVNVPLFRFQNNDNKLLHSSYRQPLHIWWDIQNCHYLSIFALKFVIDASSFRKRRALNSSLTKRSSKEVNAVFFFTVFVFSHKWTQHLSQKCSIPIIPFILITPTCNLVCKSSMQKRQ